MPVTPPAGGSAAPTFRPRRARWARGRGRPLLRFCGGQSQSGAAAPTVIPLTFYSAPVLKPPRCSQGGSHSHCLRQSREPPGGGWGGTALPTLLSAFTGSPRGVEAGGPRVAWDGHLQTQPAMTAVWRASCSGIVRGSGLLSCTSPAALLPA